MRHGNEDTIREMLRIKRSVQALYNTQFTAHLIAQQTQLATGTETSSSSAGSSAQAEQQQMSSAESNEQPPPPPAKRPDQVSFVRGDTFIAGDAEKTNVSNPDEISLDDE